jgi:hypothetical protein
MAHLIEEGLWFTSKKKVSGWKKDYWFIGLKKGYVSLVRRRAWFTG